MTEFGFTADQTEKLQSWENILNHESVKTSLEDLCTYMVSENNLIIRVDLAKEDIECIQHLNKPVSEFCRDAVHERLTIIRMCKENFILDTYLS